MHSLRLVAVVAIACCTVFIVVTAEDDAAQWSYSDYANYGPSQWALVAFDDDATNTCDGSSQSPIAIAETTHCNAYADYTTSSDCGVDQLEFQITDHNVQASVLDPSVCSIRGLVDNTATWNLVSVHAHLGWEHTPNTRCGVDAAQSEVHFIHQSSEDASLMVVALWLEASDDDQSNDVLDYLLQQWSALGEDNNANCQDYVDDDDDGGEQRRLDDGSQEVLKLYDLIPRDSDVYAYNGSLTTPPCTEGVTWRVMDETVRMSMSQYNTLVELITGYRDADTCERLTVADLSQNRTTRPTMPLNDREVLHICPTGIRRKLISFWLLGVAAVGAGAAGLLCRHRRVMNDNHQPLILISTVTELSNPYD